MTWNIYLSGEIHTEWRDEIKKEASKEKMNINFTEPVTNHEFSDDCGVVLTGPEDNKFWHDHKGAKLNAIRTRTFIERSDIVVVRFGDQYKHDVRTIEADHFIGEPKEGMVCSDRIVPRSEYLRLRVDGFH